MSEAELQLCVVAPLIATKELLSHQLEQSEYLARIIFSILFLRILPKLGKQRPMRGAYSFVLIIISA